MPIMPKIYFLTTKNIPIITNKKPSILNREICSLKTKTPTIIAVRGSSAPIIDVFVAPISFIAIFTVSIATIVGIIARPKTYIN